MLLFQMNIRDIKIIIHLCDIFPEMCTDSGEFFSVDTDDAKLINLGNIKQVRGVRMLRVHLAQSAEVKQGQCHHLDNRSR
jgi:hypothetical protein